MPLNRSAHGGVGRIFFLFGGIFALAMMLTGALVFVWAEHSIATRIDADLVHHAGKFLHRDDGSAASPADIAARIRDWQARKITSERTYSLFDPAGRLVAGRLNLRPDPGFADVRFLGGGKTWQRGRALTEALGDGSRFVIVQHSEAAASLGALLPHLVIAAFVAAMAAGLGVTWLFAHLTARRLAATGDTADAIAAAGDLARRVPMDGLDGMFARQALSLNRMLDRMERLVETQRHFAAALAHDLRTPLTRMASQLAPARIEGDAAARRQAIAAATRECNGIIAIFDALSRLAEIEGGRLAVSPAPLRLDELVGDLAETMEPVIADAGGTLACGPLDPAMVAADAGLITQMLINLLQNIATHTPAGTTARVSVRRVAEEAVLCVEDNGPGIAAEECARVLRPFARGAGAAERRGSGLGLAIADAIVRFHRGRIELVDNAPGLAVRIALPMAASPAKI